MGAKTRRRIAEKTFLPETQPNSSAVTNTTQEGIVRYREKAMRVASGEQVCRGRERSTGVTTAAAAPESASTSHESRENPIGSKSQEKTSHEVSVVSSQRQWAATCEEVSHRRRSTTWSSDGNVYLRKCSTAKRFGNKHQTKKSAPVATTTQQGVDGYQQTVPVVQHRIERELKPEMEETREYWVSPCWRILTGWCKASREMANAKRERKRSCACLVQRSAYLPKQEDSHEKEVRQNGEPRVQRYFIG